MIEGMILLYMLWGAGKGLVNATMSAAAGGARAGAAAAGQRTAAARSHPNRAVRGAGHAAHGAGVILGGLGRGAAAGGKAAAQGAREGWAEGRERGQRWVETAPARREARDERRRQRREARDARRQQWQARKSGPETSQTDPAVSDPAPDGDATSPATEPAEPPQPPPARCQWGDADGREACDGEATTYFTDQDGVRWKFCGDHKPAVDDKYRAAGMPLDWQPIDATTETTTETTTEGVTAVADQTAIPTGEVQGKADTEKALAGYRGAVTTYQDDAAGLKQEASKCRQMARRLAEDLQSSQLGPDTVAAAGGCAEWADILDRAADQLITECEAVLSAVAEFEDAVAAHDSVEAAAVANTDGGTTEFHADDSRSGGYVDNTK